MFDSLKAMGALAHVMKNRDAIEAGMRRVRDRLGVLRCVGSAGGGAVRVTCSGELNVVEVQLEPMMLGSGQDPATLGMVQRLIAEATNDAMLKARQAAAQEVQREAQALGLGDLVKGIGQGTGGLGGLLGM